MIKYFLLLVTLSLFVSCSKNDVDISDEYVYNGSGGIKCEVDGVLLKPSTAIVYGNARLNADSTLDGIPFMTLSFLNNDVSTGLGFQAIRVAIMNVDPKNNLVGNVYELKTEENGENFGNYILGIENTFATNQNYTGQFKVLYHDVEKRVLGGTFWFDAENSENETRQIRNGEFDLRIN